MVGRPFSQLNGFCVEDALVVKEGLDVTRSAVASRSNLASLSFCRKVAILTLFPSRQPL